jgi:hypothetical protein
MTVDLGVVAVGFGFFEGLDQTGGLEAPPRDIALNKRSSSLRKASVSIPLVKNNKRSHSGCDVFNRFCLFVTCQQLKNNVREREREK